MKINIEATLFSSDMKTDILKVVYGLKYANGYTNQNAIDDLLKFIEKHDIGNTEYEGDG